jgi:hypothetical protein
MVEHLKGTKEMERLEGIRVQLRVVSTKLGKERRKTSIAKLEKQLEDLVNESVDLIASIPRPKA